MKFLTATIGEQLLDGVSNMIVGLGVVFAVLILLCVIIWAFRFIGKLDKSSAADAAPAAPKKAPVPAAAPAAAAPKTPGKMAEGGVELEGVDADTAAAVLGAVAQECGGSFKVKSIKKSE